MPGDIDVGSVDWGVLCKRRLFFAPGLLNFSTRNVKFADVAALTEYVNRHEPDFPKATPQAVSDAFKLRAMAYYKLKGICKAADLYAEERGYEVRAQSTMIVNAVFACPGLQELLKEHGWAPARLETETGLRSGVVESLLSGDRAPLLIMLRILKTFGIEDADRIRSCLTVSAKHAGLGTPQHDGDSLFSEHDIQPAPQNWRDWTR